MEDAGHVPGSWTALLTGPRAFVRDRIFHEGDVSDRGLLARIVAQRGHRPGRPRGELLGWTSTQSVAEGVESAAVGEPST